jgi:spore maturation protein CgeB
MYDQIYTGSRCYRDYFKNLGLPVFLLRHAFETSIFDKLPVVSKKKEVCLNGSIMFNVHNSRLDILNEFNREGIPYTYYGTISGRIEDLMASENTYYLKILNDIKPSVKKAVFGMEYYHTLNMHEICVNAHYKYNYDHPLNAHGGNIRMFEVTGVGSCLLTDNREEIAELFDVDKEIVVYHSMEELKDKAKWLLNNPKKVKEIAMAGQKRTFKDHNYRRKAEQLNEYIQELLN